MSSSDQGFQSPSASPSVPGTPTSSPAGERPTTPVRLKDNDKPGSSDENQKIEEEKTDDQDKNAAEKNRRLGEQVDAHLDRVNLAFKSGLLCIL